MRVLFVTGQAHLPQSFGGVQASTEATIQALHVRGHQGAVACALWGGDRVALRARFKMPLGRTRNVLDKVRGYPVYRSWEPVENVRDTVEAFKPDVAVVQHMKTVPFVKRLQATGTPIAVYLRNLEFDELGGDLASLPAHVRYIANSHFTARRYRERFGIDPIVLPPLINRDRYHTPPGGYVTMINPAIEKGINITLSLVEQCPDIPFMIVQGWGGDDAILAQIANLQRQGRNLILAPRTDDMRSIYSQTKVLLVPSQWEEAWGRVVSEAHVSGIPVIGSDRGGLPEAIGPGGRIVPHDAPITLWEQELRNLWDDPHAWKAASLAAETYSRRPELSLDGHVQILLDTLEMAQSACSTQL